MYCYPKVVKDISYCLINKNSHSLFSLCLVTAILEARLLALRKTSLLSKKSSIRGGFMAVQQTLYVSWLDILPSSMCISRSARLPVLGKHNNYCSETNINCSL